MPWWQFLRMTEALRTEKIDADDAVREAELVVARMRERRAQGRGIVSRPPGTETPNSWYEAQPWMNGGAGGE